MEIAAGIMIGLVVGVIGVIVIAGLVVTRAEWF